VNEQDVKLYNNNINEYMANNFSSKESDKMKPELMPKYYYAVSLLAVRTVFMYIDTNQNGRISKDEWEKGVPGAQFENRLSEFTIMVLDAGRRNLLLIILQLKY
jgi:hypothetical protein